ncbi:MAG: CoA transferase [Bacteroidota bacterium]
MQITAKQLIKSIPQRFKEEKAKDYHTIINFEIKGDDGGQFHVVINNGECKVFENLSNKPKCSLKTKAKNYILLETGKLNPQMALLTGKLKVSNINEMLKFTKCFRRFRADQLSDDKKSIVRPEKNGPLKGIRILDLTRLLPGPLATMYLAEMGADVIKIEDPDSPDYIRDYPPVINGQSAYYQTLNRSKRSLTLNFSSEKDIHIFYKLLQKADVIIEQFRPGVMDKMGLSFDELKKHKPNIVFVSLSGYGQNGEYSNMAGHDLNYMANSGLLNLNRDENGKPVIPNFQIADIAGGSYMLLAAVSTAILARDKTNEAQKVDISMMDGIMPLMTMAATEYWADKKNGSTSSGALSGKLANYNVYQCADDKWIALAALEPKFWNIFCELIEKPEWKEWVLPEISEKNNLKQKLTVLFKTKTRDEWVAHTKNTDACLSPVNDFDDILRNQHIQDRKQISSIKNTPLKSFNQPIKFNEDLNDNIWEAPDLGEDNYQIIKDLG